MAYRTTLGNQFKSQLKEVALEEHLELIREECIDVRINPLRPTEPLVGNLSIPGLRYRKITTTTPQYRIMFMTYACGYDNNEGVPYCEHDKCPVGIQDEFESEEQNGTTLASVIGLESSNEPPIDSPCDGLIKYAIFGTRELIGNLYKLRKKDFQKYLKV